MTNPLNNQEIQFLTENSDIIDLGKAGYGELVKKLVEANANHTIPFSSAKWILVTLIFSIEGKEGFALDVRVRNTRSARKARFGSKRFDISIKFVNCPLTKEQKPFTLNLKGVFPPNRLEALATDAIRKFGLLYNKYTPSDKMAFAQKFDKIIIDHVLEGVDWSQWAGQDEDGDED